MKQLKLLLFFAICAIACPNAFGETYSGSCGENVTWMLDTSTGVLTISGKGAMHDYNPDYYYDLPWHSDRRIIISVSIEKGVTSIGDYAFYQCSSLASINIPESVTSIGKRAFAYCTGLTSINIPESVTSIGDDAFSDCI